MRRLVGLTMMGIALAMPGSAAQAENQGDGPAVTAQQIAWREGDVIVAFNGEAVAGIDELHHHLVAEVIGVACTITVVRHTEKLDLVVTPEELVRDNRRN